MELGNFKRDYHYRSDTSKYRTSYWIAIIISVIAFLVIWYYF